MVTVQGNGGWGLTYTDELSEEQRDNPIQDLLEDVFVDGELVRFQTLADIRERLNA